MFAGSTEIQMLCWAVVLGLVQLVIATSAATLDQGLPYNLSPRDAAPPPVKPVTARLLRAFHNFKETFVFFAVAVLIVTALGKTNATSALGAEIYPGGAGAVCADLCRRHSGAAHPDLDGIDRGHRDGAAGGAGLTVRRAAA